ncbi:MAG: hypothetical protein PHT40_00390 [Patescibacteria group bacterium]|nr:hypothetical protein [Patescibacteria group bacterium]
MSDLSKEDGFDVYIKKRLISENVSFTDAIMVLAHHTVNMFNYFSTKGRRYPFTYLSRCYLTAVLVSNFPKPDEQGEGGKPGPPWDKKKITYKISFAHLISLVFCLGIMGETGFVIKREMTEKENEKIATHFLIHGKKIKEETITT